MTTNIALFKQQFDKQCTKLFQPLIGNYFIIKDLKSEKGSYLNGKPCKMVGYQLFPYVKIHVIMVLPELKDTTTYQLNIKNLDSFPNSPSLIRCANHELPLLPDNIYYKCSVCPNLFLCQQCQNFNSFHPDHPFIKIRPIGWELPLPLNLKIKEIQKTIRKNKYDPEKESLLTPKQAAVYDQMIRITLKGKGYVKQQDAERFTILNRWFRSSCPQAWINLVS